MVDIIGHLGMGLIWLTIVGWLAYDGKTALGFVALGAPFSLLPDIDLWLSKAFATVNHHGVVHTIVFVAGASIVIGAILAKWVVPRFDGDYLVRPAGSSYVYAIGAVFVGGLSHLFADMLSAPDIAPQVEPFWPFIVTKVVTVDVFYYNDPVVNWGLFLSGLALAGILWWQADDSDSAVTA